jgi:glycosyltransferase involved in cell wall biosynthesis
MSRKRILSTLRYPAREAWNAEVDTVAHGRRRDVIREILRRAGQYDVLVLDGSIGIHAKNPDLMAAVLLNLRRRRPAVVFAESNWKVSSGWDARLRRLGMRLIDRVVDVFCVVSRHEERVFAGTWGIDPGKVVYTPFYWTFAEEEFLVPGTMGTAVFAGGNPMRDYGTLIEAVRGTGVETVIATSRPDVVGRTDLPPEVRAGRIPHEEFVHRVRGAGVVVVPLAGGTERSGGEQTYLNAMGLGKVVVVTDAPGVSDYVRHRETGLVVPAGDVDAMREAITWVLDPANRAEVDRIGAAAREDALARYGPDTWITGLLGAAHRAMAMRSPGAAEAVTG